MWGAACSCKPLRATPTIRRAPTPTQGLGQTAAALLDFLRLAPTQHSTAHRLGPAMPVRPAMPVGPTLPSRPALPCALRNACVLCNAWPPHNTCMCAPQCLAAQQCLAGPQCPAPPQCLGRLVSDQRDAAPDPTVELYVHLTDDAEHSCTRRGAHAAVQWASFAQQHPASGLWHHIT